jgi:hypothetical protein
MTLKAAVRAGLQQKGRDLFSALYGPTEVEP